MTTAGLRKDVADLLLYFEKTVRAVKLYPPSNPHRQEFVDRLAAMFSATLAQQDLLTLRVSRLELTCEGETVYTNDDRQESLAFVLYKDGIRELSFSRGLARSEVLEVVQAFNRDFTVEYLDDDVATYLWDRDLANVRIVVTDDFLDEALPEELRNAADPAEAARHALQLEVCATDELRRRILGGDTAAGRVAIPLRRPLVKPARLRLAEAEVVQLRQLQARDAENSYLEEMLGVVISVLSLERSDAAHGIYYSLFQSLLESHIEAGTLSRAVTVVRRLRRAALEATFAAPVVGGFVDRLGRSELWERLGRRLEEGGIADPELLPEFLSLFPASAIPGVVTLLGAVTSMKQRKLVCEALAKLGSQDPRLLGMAARDTPWYVARNLAYTIGLIGERRAVPPLADLSMHPDPRVRKEALRGIGRIDAPEAVKVLLQGLAHREEATRLQALHALPRAPRPSLAAELARMVGEPGFTARRLAERVEWYRALGRVSDDSLVPAMEKRLARRGLHRLGVGRDTRHLAAQALIARASPAARAALARAVGQTDDETRRLIESHLRSRASTGSQGQR